MQWLQGAMIEKHDQLNTVHRGPKSRRNDSSLEGRDRGHCKMAGHDGHMSGGARGPQTGLMKEQS